MTHELFADGLRGRHLCREYSNDLELAAVVAGFVDDGLRSGERVGYITASDVPAVSGRLTAVADGALEVLALADVRRSADGSWTEEVAAWVQQFLASSPDERDGGLRLAAEAHAVGVTGETVEQMQAREARAEALTVERALTLLCLYDRRRFGPELLAAAAGAHEPRGTGDLLHADALLTVTRHGDPCRLVVAGEVDLSNVSALRAVLAEVADGTADGLRIDVSGLRHIDVAGLRAVVETATARPDVPVVLHRAPPLLLRMLDLSGWRGVPNLVVDDGGGPS